MKQMEATNYDIIEKTRQDFSTNVESAAAMISLGLLDVDELATFINVAGGCWGVLAQAYAADLSRMYAILEQLKDREIPEGIIDLTGE